MTLTPKQKLWARRLWGKSKKRAKADSIEFDLSPEDIIVPLECPVMGVPLLFEKGISDHLPSLDRVDNSKGYVRGNVRVISWRANYLKKNLTLEQMKRLLHYMEIDTHGQST
jgi:hypothetical protein